MRKSPKTKEIYPNKNNQEEEENESKKKIKKKAKAESIIMMERYVKIIYFEL